ncbi:hypothetical protein RFI_40029 [Reticulomyxa filosa]|uniref:Transmembrane protein n=1 Tax=Reticulomyxa filosa TaxID=46433 RepID=X6L7U1_RETFI|nr:hypothetical protein RFI_40029 [Reticulomyxa filosa]|eukprot:ETN97500.1 hypothetical protein RFI_40029 [Reticulomyxa filosa]
MFFKEISNLFPLLHSTLDSPYPIQINQSLRRVQEHDIQTQKLVCICHKPLQRSKSFSYGHYSNLMLSGTVFVCIFYPIHQLSAIAQQNLLPSDLLIVMCVPLICNAFCTHLTSILCAYYFLNNYQLFCLIRIAFYQHKLVRSKEFTKHIHNKICEWKQSSVPFITFLVDNIYVFQKDQFQFIKHAILSVRGAYFPDLYSNLK